MLLLLLGVTNGAYGQPPSADQRAAMRAALVARLKAMPFPMIDYHVHLKGGLTIGEVVEQCRTTGIGSIIAGGVAARFDPATGQLTLSKDGRDYAVAQFAEPGRAECAVVKVGGDGPLSPGSMLNIGPGENRVAVREGSPFVYLRRDCRGQPAPKNRFEALTAVLDLGVEAGQLRGVGPAGLFSPGANPGQHVLTAVADPATGAGVVSGLVRIEAVSGVVLTRLQDGKVHLVLRNDYGCTVPPELEPAGGDWWAIGYFADAREGLEAYAAEFARINGVQVKRAPTGYCTWYAEKHGGPGDEKSILELADYSARTFAPYGYGFVQIDDQWQDGITSHGPAKDFTRVNPQGPYKSGLKPVADKIRALGLTPGLWLLPFAINHKDSVFTNRLDWVVRRADGSPFEANWSGTALDLTRPEVRQYVHGFIAQAVKDWGYRYLKLDGLHIGMATPQTYPNLQYMEDDYSTSVFADKTKSNMQAGRWGLQTVRTAAGPETFILGCCCPQNERSLGMVLGLVDAMRVGEDNGGNWGGILHGVRAVNPIYYLNGRVWWNDPDPVYARGSVPMNEFQCYGSWVALIGSLFATSDWSPDYAPDRVDALRRLMPNHQLTSVRPVDLFENDPARCWVLTYDVSGQRHTVVGLFNWGNVETDLGATAAKLGLKGDATYAGFDFWASRRIADFRGELRQKVPPHACRIIALREARVPAVLSTSRHVTQGAVDLTAEKWEVAAQTFSGTSQLVAGDAYEVRLLTGGAGTKGTTVAHVSVSAADQAAGVTASVTHEGDLARIKIVSPASRTVTWAALLSGGK